MPDSDLKFSAAEIDVLLHATEDESRVTQSLEDVLSIPKDRFSALPSEGHYKNKIVLLKAAMASREAGDLAVRIISLLNSADREHLRDGIDGYSDEKGNLYLRLDKQRICQGKVSLSEADAIRIKFKPIRRYKPSGNIESYRGLLSSIG
jgi:RNA binding exosome subunit